jgi:transcription elongation factor GreA
MVEQQNYPMTAERLEALRAELKHKLEVEKPALSARLKAAIELGDLSENADYITAKEDMGFLQGRIDQLQEMVRGAQIIIENKSGDGIIQLGTCVTVMEDGDDHRETFILVGKVEANPREGKISNESPLGSAILGRKVGDVVRIKTPDGDTVFKIVEIC